MKNNKVKTIIRILKEMDLYGHSTYSVGELEKIAKEANVTMLDVMWAIRYEV